MLTPGPLSLLWGPDQTCRRSGDNQLTSAAVQNPGSLKGPQEGNAGPRYKRDDKVPGQELASRGFGGVPGEKQPLQTVPGARPITRGGEKQEPHKEGSKGI